MMIGLSNPDRVQRQFENRVPSVGRPRRRGRVAGRSSHRGMGWRLLDGEDDYKNHDGDKPKSVQGEVDPITLFHRVDIFGNVIGDFIDEKLRISSETRGDSGTTRVRDTIKINGTILVFFAVNRKRDRYAGVY